MSSSEGAAANTETLVPKPPVQISFDSLQAALRANEMWMTSMGSAADPGLLDTFHVPFSPLIAIGITLLFICIVAILVGMNSYKIIRANWATYRCHPEVTPFASFYGYNLKETMNFCVGELVKEHAPGVINPIYKAVEEVMGVVDGVYDEAVAIEGEVVGLLSGFEAFVVNFMNSMRLVGTQIRMSAVRIKDIFGRLYGSFFSIVFAGISAITFGSNLVCNPLIVFIAGLAGSDICCFHPNTLIVMNDGDHKRICEMKIGEQLEDGVIVTSIYEFNGSETAMVSIYGIQVSGNHYIRSAGRMIRADRHPAARSCDSFSRIFCLGTNRNTIPVLNNIGFTEEFADYEESEEPAVIYKTQLTAERLLNGASSEPGPPVADYSLGIDPTALVLMGSGTWKPLYYIQIGDVLAPDHNIVSATIAEYCRECYRTPDNVLVSAAQLVQDGSQWKRSAYLYGSKQHGFYIMRHLFATKGFFIIRAAAGTRLYKVRDYREVDSPELQTPYDEALASKGEAGLPFVR
jgi:hypothetical protein